MFPPQNAINPLLATVCVRGGFGAHAGRSGAGKCVSGGNSVVGATTQAAYCC